MLIRGGTLIDGTGSPRYQADLLIEGDTIAAMGTSLSAEGHEVVDATGMVVCPGFIDTHSHSDLKVLEDPLLAPKIRQGITTEILGQDGVSMAPLPLEFIADWKKNLAGLDGTSETIDWKFQTTEGYLKAMERRGLVIHESYLVPHGNVRMEAMGLEDRAPTPLETEAMKKIVRREMEAGALGLSSGLIYIPCAYGDTTEVIEMCRVVAGPNGVFVVHQRSEANAILSSMDEILTIGRESGVRLHFSHFKICGRKNWGKLEAVLAKLDDAKAEGLSVTFDQYPYMAGSTMLGAILPSWAHAGGTNKLLERLRDDETRKRIVADILEQDCDWDNFVEFAGLDGISITSVQTASNTEAVGLTLVELGAKRGKDPLEATLDLLLEEENAVGMIDVYGSEEHVKAFILRPEMNLCTDGLLGGRPHPRVYGAFPRLLRYARDERLLSFEEAIRKMTGQPAAVFGFHDRGVLKVGNKADVVVFDPETVCDRATYTRPIQFPDGILKVIVRGRTVWNGTALDTAGFPGRVLRGAPMKALTRATLFDFETFRPDSYLLFDRTIVASGPMEEFPGADEVIDLADAWVMPGFVVGHTHLYSTFARGWAPPFSPKNFTQLLEQLWWKLDAGLDLEAVAFSGRVGALASLKAGVTTLIDHHASGVIRGSLAALQNAVVEETGLRGIFAFETSDRFDLEACIEENRSFARHPGSRSAGMLGLHAGLTLSDQSLDRIAKATDSLPIHVHLSEAPEDKGTASRFDSRGLWRPGSLAVHGVHLASGDAALLAHRGIPLALNPSSNLSNGVGLPDLEELRREKVRFGIGTDGLGFGLGPEVRNLVFSQRHRALDPMAAGLDDVHAALRTNWDFAGDALGCQLGRIEPGYEADLVVVDYHPPTPIDATNAMGHWFYGLLEAWRPRFVWVAGTPRLVAYKPLVAEAELHQEARSVAQALWKRIS